MHFEMFGLLAHVDVDIVVVFASLCFVYMVVIDNTYLL